MPMAMVFLYRTTLVLWLFILVCCLLAALYDILQQFFVAGNGPGPLWARIYNGITAAAAFVLIGILSACISISRIITVNRTLATIPKGYLPVAKGDLPEPIHRLISSEYSRCAMIRHLANPEKRPTSGWGAPGSAFEGVHLRSSLISTSEALEMLLAEHSHDPTFTSLPLSSSTSVLPSYHTQKPFSQAPQPSTPLTARLAKALSPSFAPLINIYGTLLDKALYACKEPTQKDYEDAVRLFGVLAAGLTPQKAT